MKDVYPVTIIKDRYTGTYSGGLFTAWNRYADELPEGPEADDVTCMKFWLDNTEPVGIANTPEAALADLETKLFDGLQTCPFCGGAAEILTESTGTEHGEFYARYRIRCKHCGCSGSIHRFKVVVRFAYGGGVITDNSEKQKAIDAWNTRAAEAGVWEV